MHDKLIRQINNEIADLVVSHKNSGFTNRKSVITLLKKVGWNEKISGLFPINKRISCIETLELCLPAMAKISDSEPQEGWSKFCYQFVCNMMFPDEQYSPLKEWCQAAVFYLCTLQILFDHERQALPFDPLTDFDFLSDEKYESCDSAREYRRLMYYWREEFIYELMRLGAEITPYKTLSHIAGVHYIAMNVAKGLENSGVDVDLALVSAAAASHDFGKFGCRPGERVPYLHYYYTDIWLDKRKMDGISHIAANHSTWDLELESLSVESLLLIYSDFRSKQTYDENGNEITVLFPLDKSFEVILSKLDNVDEAKQRRYAMVYGRLHDFEDYMRSLGVDVDLTGKPQAAAEKKDASLLDPDQTLESLILLSVEHNLKLMNMLSSEKKFGNIIESARSAKSWQQLRAYLDIFDEYFTYLSVRQKTQAIDFLYELLIHREGDIRRQAGGLIGKLIAKFHLFYRKELPKGVEKDPAEERPFEIWEKFIDMIVYPDHKTTPQQRSHIGYTLKLVVGSMLKNAREDDIPRFLATVFKYYDNAEDTPYDSAFTLLDAIRYLPAKYYDNTIRSKLIEFAAHFACIDDLRLVTAALEYLLEVERGGSARNEHIKRIVDIANDVKLNNLTTIYLKCELLRNAGHDVSALEEQLYNNDITSEVFLDNLKIATPWVVKVAGVEMLRDQLAHGITTHMLHIATHFSNLVKMSERVVVRQSAGNALVDILSHLRRDQRNEVVVELGKGLEMGRYEISKYIPEYLGQAALYLHPSELDEQIIWLKSLLGTPSDSSASCALNTAGILLQHYPEYKNRFKENDEKFEERRQLLLGILLQGLAHYREAVRQEALLVFGKLLFESPALDMEEKSHLFSLCYRKLLFLINESSSDSGLTFFYRASALSHINRFITLRRLDHGPFTFEAPKKIAFFPGTFDPFTLSHKGIVHAIREMGFEVYLAIDEFSWSKKAQPHLIRRQIVNMSIAGDFHVHLFPVDIPVNIANPSDLKRMSELFPDQDVYIVAGSDVVTNASAYRNEAKPYSIHQMNHIIFRRAGDAKLAKNLPISGDVILLNLPQHLKDISSSRIRENVDLNRDISNFIDPVIQDFIYQNGLYLRDSQNKTMLYTGEVEFEWNSAYKSSVYQKFGANIPFNENILLIRKTDSQQILGFASYRLVAISELYDAIGDNELSNRIRLRSAGNIVLITALETDSSDRHNIYKHLLLSELLAKTIEKEYVYAVYYPNSKDISEDTESVLRRMGFVSNEGKTAIREVDMHAPVVMIQNLETTIQEPLSRNSRIRSVIRRSHEKLQLAMTALYPGELVLILSSDVIHHRLLEKITSYNNVPSVPTTPRVLGEYMCVPFGKLLRNKIVPNTVTKTIHTDRVYSPDLKEGSIEAYPNYPPIPSQIRTIKSFNRPIILVDDLMHPGFRMKTLDPYLRHENVPIKMVLVGVLSGYGRDLMRSWNHPIDSVYYMPRIRQWFVESTLYPFIGGNTVRRNSIPIPGMMPGINHILPYAVPAYEDECGRKAVFELSKACLECAYDIMTTLEQEYRALYGRNLTLSRLPEAIILPLCPDKGTCLSYDPNLSASVYIENDLELLLRQHM